MAQWIPQTFKYGNMEVELNIGDVVLRTNQSKSFLPTGIKIAPNSRDEAHDLALLFRKAARRFEEIGKELK